PRSPDRVPRNRADFPGVSVGSSPPPQAYESRPVFSTVRPSVTPAEFERTGLSPDAARALARRVNDLLRHRADRTNPDAQVRHWLEFRGLIETDPILREAFGAQAILYRMAYDGRPGKDGPGPAWIPSPDTIRMSNLGSMMGDRRVDSYADLHRWSTEHRAEFWSAMIERLGITFRTMPKAILEPNADPTHPDWLPRARLNIAESCFRAEPGKTAIVCASEAAPELRHVTYGELHRLAARVANGLSAIGTKPGDRVALYLPMTPESVGIYLGVVLAGCCVVGIADASAPADFAKRSG